MDLFLASQNEVLALRRQALEAGDFVLANLLLWFAVSGGDGDGDGDDDGERLLVMDRMLEEIVLKRGIWE